MDDKNINNLPVEILEIIFSYFDELTILRGKCVNKLWNNVLSHNFKVWIPSRDFAIKNLRKTFLESCRIGNLILINSLSRFISKNLLKLDCSSYELWGEGLIISSRYGHLDVVKLISKFGVSHTSRESLSEAVKNNNYEVVDFLLKEFHYNPHQLNQIFDKYSS